LRKLGVGHNPQATQTIFPARDIVTRIYRSIV
jgi:hypothetical protein